MPSFISRWMWVLLVALMGLIGLAIVALGLSLSSAGVILGLSCVLLLTLGGMET